MAAFSEFRFQPATQGLDLQMHVISQATTQAIAFEAKSLCETYAIALDLEAVYLFWHFDLLGLVQTLLRTMHDLH